jgi:hypothetical protein
LLVKRKKWLKKEIYNLEMRYLKLYEEFVFSDIAKKYQWVELSFEDRKKLKHEVWELIDTAYSTLGGHVRISKKDDIFNDKELTFWSAVDVDDDPYCDVVIFGKKTTFGNKLSGWGHDGQKISKKELFNKLSNILSNPGVWLEASGRPAEILLSKGIKYLNSKEEIQKIFPNSEINWIGDGKYTRKLPSGLTTDEEFIFGNPNI